MNTDETHFSMDHSSSRTESQFIPRPGRAARYRRLGRWGRCFCGVAALLLVIPQRSKSDPVAKSAGADHDEAAPRRSLPWTSLGLSGGGGMFTPAISPVDPKLLL